MAAFNTTPLQQTGDKTPIPPVPPPAEPAKPRIISEMASQVAPNRPVDPATKQADDRRGRVLPRRKARLRAGT